MFLVDADNPGLRASAARVGAIDRSFPGGHAEVVFAGLPRAGATPCSARSGEGFATRRCGWRRPASRTACAGSASPAARSTSRSTAPREREAFGARLDELGMVQAMIADSVHRPRVEPAADLAVRLGARPGGAGAARVLGRRRCFVAEAVDRVVDRAVQICGALGVSDDLPLGALPRRGARRSASTTAPPRRTAGRSPAAPPATARGPSAGPEVAAPAAVEIVDTPEQAADLALAPLLVRRPLEAFLDAHGLGRGPLAAQRIGAGSSNVTYLVERDGARVVLRRPPRPPLPPSAHDVLREARLLRALAANAGAGAGGARDLRRRRRCSASRSTSCRCVEGDGADGAPAARARRAGGAARASRTSSSTRWSRCTPSTWTRSGSPTSAARRATSSARSAASRGSGR